MVVWGTSKCIGSQAVYVQCQCACDVMWINFTHHILPAKPQRNSVAQTLNPCKNKGCNVQQLHPPSTGQQAPRPTTALKHQSSHYLKCREERACTSTQPATPRTQQTSSQAPATQPLLPAPDPQDLHHHAPGCTRVSCLQSDA